MTQLTDSTKPLSYSNIYTCPVCRHGKISAIPLMEAFGCNFCRHIFTVNLENQMLKMADSQLPLTWRWDGITWKGIYREGVEAVWFYWILGATLVVLPPMLIAAAVYLFPPLPGSPLSWFPIFWTIVTFFCHLFFVGWLVVQYYQFPVFLYLKALGTRLFSRLPA